MSGRRSSRREAWKTFTVRVVEVRGASALTATVGLTSVQGVDGAPYREHIVWQGIVSRREAGQHLSPEEAAELAVTALRSAYPGLF